MQPSGADQYIWSTSFYIIIAWRKRIEGDLKNLAIDRIYAIDEFGLETKPHPLPNEQVSHRCG